jgi:hypothetical protein
MPALAGATTTARPAVMFGLNYLEESLSDESTKKRINKT